MWNSVNPGIPALYTDSLQDCTSVRGGDGDLNKFLNFPGFLHLLNGDDKPGSEDVVKNNENGAEFWAHRIAQ